MGKITGHGNIRYPLLKAVFDYQKNLAIHTAFVSRG
jgi:hypothetical protein